MFRNYLKIAWRNLTKYKFISFINLFGLTVGLTCCLLILTYILHELSYDKYHNNSENIYRVTRIFNNPQTKDVSLHLGTVSPPFGPLLQNDFKQIQKMTRLLSNGNTAFRYEDKIFYENDCYFADEYLFDVFKVDVTKGNPKKALTDPFSVMLKEDIAKKYFGNEDPINKTVRLDNNIACKVTGVFKAFPSNSHVHPGILISFNTLKDTSIYGEENLRTNWGNNSFLTYMVLPENTNIKSMEAQFPAFIDRHMPRNTNSRFKQSEGTSLTLQKLTDIHLRSHLDYEAEENGDIKRVYVFSAIALFILLIACINYMNLATARSALRAREIGVRKVVGAQRKELISQFLSESVLLCFVAIILAFGLTALTLPWLNEASGQNLSIQMLMRWQVLLPLFFVPIVIGIVSGLYPAIFLSSFRPVMVLKGLFKARGANISFRKVLVTAQFAISIILIVATAIVFQQLKYMQNTNLGFDRDHIVTMPYLSGLNENYESFRNELLSNSNFKNVGRSGRIPTGRLLDAMGARVRSGDTLAPSNVTVKYVMIDKDFMSTYGIKVVAGRGFSRDFTTDSASFLINEAAVKELGFGKNEDAVGKPFGYGGIDGQLIGVFNDFHFESMHQTIVPMVLLMPRTPNFYGNISVKISGANIAATLEHMEKTWKKFQPESPYSYTFMDERFDRIYQSESRQATIFTVFAFIAIFIACLGLLGLSAFAISQRLKEIGIRKVLGASIGNIVGLLSKDFLKLVVLAALIAFPVAWYAMRSWLNDFAYRINIPWWIFLVAGLVAAAVALITISFQAVRAATANPVKSLRTE